MLDLLPTPLAGAVTTVQITVMVSPFAMQSCILAAGGSRGRKRGALARLNLMRGVHILRGRFPSDRHDHRHCVMNALDDAKTICSERGARLTPVRQRVLEIIWQSHRPLGGVRDSRSARQGRTFSGTAHGLPRARVSPHARPRASTVVSQRVHRLHASGPSRCGAVPSLHRMRHRGGTQRCRHRACDRAQRRGRGVRLARAHRRNQRALSSLPRRLTTPAPWPGTAGSVDATGSFAGLRDSPVTTGEVEEHDAGRLCAAEPQ